MSVKENYIHIENEHVPWTPLRKPLAQCRVALVTMGGLYLPGQEPFWEALTDGIEWQGELSAPQERSAESGEGDEMGFAVQPAQPAGYRPIVCQTFRELPRTLRTGDYLVFHPHYNHEWVLADMNCQLPLEVFAQMEAEGIIGELADTHYSFMGSIPDPIKLISDTAPEAGRRMRERGVDVCVLAPS